MTVKNMNLLNVASLGIGNMVGAGIFALLGQVILSAGNDTYLAFVFAGVTALICGYSYSKLAELYPESGGIIDYFKHSFNKVFSIIFSFIYFFTLIVSIAMLSKSFGIYAVNLFQLSKNFVPIFSSGIILFLGFLNIYNSNIVGKMESVLVILKLSVLCVLICLSFIYFFDGYKVVDNKDLIDINFWQAVAFAFFAYAGFGVMSNTAGDLKNPRKTIPLAIFIAIFFVIFLYNGLAFVVINFVPEISLKQNLDTSIVQAANIFFSNAGFLIISLAGMLALSSGINALFYSSFKIIESMADYDEFPKIFNKKITSKINIGFLFILVITILSCIFVNFDIISKISSCAFLISYMAIFISHFLLRKKVSANIPLIFLGFISILFIMFKILF